ncbi:MAG: pilus assembly protein TadG-related protein [Longimicrobiales bacterium]|nr:pilus assembly protein TadG-related protein [Longimicrobiales bacterium]
MKTVTKTKTFRNERGGTLVMVALSLFLILGMAALAVDLAAAFAWRAAAQKIADASALAGGSAFLDLPLDVAEQPARDRAYDYALAHAIRGERIDSSEVTVQVLVDSTKVRVWINRDQMGVWFARVIGIPTVDIGAMAAAQALRSGAARCLKPFALPDSWDDAEQEQDGDNVWDTGESWEFGSDENDRYQRFDGSDAADATSATGYGSDLRDSDGDWGRSLLLKSADPQSEYVLEPGIFFPWRLPPDPNQEDCDSGGGGTTASGGATYRKNICSCNQSLIELGEPYELEPGNMIGPTSQGIDELIAEDPDVYWEPTANGGKGNVVRPNPDGGYTEVGTSTPRVVKIALFDPTQVTSSGMQTITFNNFALMFLEDMPGSQSDVRARFMYFAGGEASPGATDGSLVRYLRLVE